MMKLLISSVIILLFLCCSNNKPWTLHIIDNDLRGADGVKLGDVNNDGRIDIVTGWEESGETRIYLNPDIHQIKRKWPFVSVGKTPSVEDAVFVDLNADGWLDVVTCCEGQEQSVFVHWNPGERELENSENWTQHIIPESKDKMQWMFCVPADIDNDGDVDLIAAGKNDGAAIGWFETPDQPEILTDYKWHSLSTVGWVMSIFISDMDDDGDEDILFSDRRGDHAAVRWLENPDDNSDSWTNHFIGAQGQEVMFMAIADFNDDALDDLVTAVKPNKIVLHSRQDNSGTLWEETEILFPPHTGTAKAVRAADLDLDGRHELVITCEHAEAPASGVFVLNRKLGTEQWGFTSVSGEDGIKFDRMEIWDVDSDGDLDILTCEERHHDRGLGVIWYENPAR